MALWHKLRETSAIPRTAAINASSSSAAAASSVAAMAPPLAAIGGGFRPGGRIPASSQYHQVVAIGAASTSASRIAAAAAAADAAANARGDLADGHAALERDLERMGVPAAGGGGGASYAACGRQMWEFKAVNKDYALSPTYPQVCGGVVCSGRRGKSAGITGVGCVLWAGRRELFGAFWLCISR